MIKDAERIVGHKASLYFTNYKSYLVYKRKIESFSDKLEFLITRLLYWYCPASDPKRNVVYVPKFYFSQSFHKPFLLYALVHELLHLKHPRWSEQKVLRERWRLMHERNPK